MGAVGRDLWKRLWVSSLRFVFRAPGDLVGRIWVRSSSWASTASCWMVSLILALHLLCGPGHHSVFPRSFLIAPPCVMHPAIWPPLSFPWGTPFSGWAPASSHLPRPLAKRKQIFGVTISILPYRLALLQKPTSLIRLSRNPPAFYPCFNQLKSSLFKFVLVTCDAHCLITGIPCSLGGPHLPYWLSCFKFLSFGS